MTTIDIWDSEERCWNRVAGNADIDFRTQLDIDVTQPWSSYATGGVVGAPDPEPEPANPARWADLPPLPRPSTRPPMWANSPQSRRRNRRQETRR